MTVAAQNPVASYTANGITTDFTLAAKVLTSTDLKVYLNGVLQSSGYTVSGVGNSGGVTVTFSSAPANGVNVVLHRVLPVDRTTDYPFGGNLSSDVLDLDQDRQTMIMQQLSEVSDRSISVPPGVNVDTEMPIPEANKVIGWNHDASALENKTPSSVGVVLAENVSFIPTVELSSTNVQDAIEEVYAKSSIGYVDVMSFGAIADGVVDDTASIQAAIAHVESSGGGTVFFPATSAFYKTTSPLLVRGDINIELLGDGNPTIKCFGVGATSNGFTVGDPVTLRSAYITLRNLKVWGSAKTNGNGLRIQQCNNVRIVNCSIYNHGQSGIYGSDTYSMRIHDSEIVENGTSGIYLTNAGANATVITRNKIIGQSSAGHAGVLVDGLHYGSIIDGNDFEFNHHGIKVNQCHGITVSNNYFETNTNGSIYVPSGSTVRGLVATGNVVLDSYFDINNVIGGLIAGNTFEKPGNVLLLANNTDLQIGSNNFPGGGAATGGSSEKAEYQAFPAWVEYSIQWYSSSSPQPSIGNGTLRAWYKRMGKTIHLRVIFIAGGTTTFGTGTWSFTLPFSANGAVTNTRYLGQCRYNHAGTINYTNIISEVVWANTNNVYLINASGGSVCGVTSPFVWASGDDIHWNITYEAL